MRCEPVRAPRTWGWTEGRRIYVRCGYESPTHVGMDRLDQPLRRLTG